MICVISRANIMNAKMQLVDMLLITILELCATNVESYISGLWSGWGGRGIFNIAFSHGQK